MNLLEACGGNLEMAVDMHMEDQGGGQGGSAGGGAAQEAGVPGAGVSGAEAAADVDSVRAPYRQEKQEVMVQPGYEGYALASRARGSRWVMWGHGRSWGVTGASGGGPGGFTEGNRGSQRRI